MKGYFRSRIYGEGQIIAYRSAPEKGDYRMDVKVRRPSGEIEVIQDLCRCGWCAKTCALQRALVDALPSELIGRGRAFDHIYPRGTRGKWVNLCQDEKEVNDAVC